MLSISCYDNSGESDRKLIETLANSWDHTYGSSHIFTDNRSLMEELFNWNNNESDMNLGDNLSEISLADAPTPYLEYGIQDFEFNITNVDVDAVEQVLNTVVADDNNNNNTEHINLIENIGDASDEQMAYSVCREDIETQSNVSNAKTRKRKISFGGESNEDYDSDSDSDDLQSIVTTRTKVKKGSQQKSANDREDKAKQRKTPKCMSRNAIAARENREKKKEYIKAIEKRNDILIKENTRLRDNHNANTERIKALEKECNYFQAIVANVPQIASLIEHVMKAPNITFVGTSFGVEDNTVLQAAKSHVSNSADSTRKSQRIASKLENPGICLHIANRNMSLELCSKCSEASKKLVKMKQK